MNGDESVGEAREPRRGSLRTAVRLYRCDLVYGANDSIFTTFSRIQSRGYSPVLTSHHCFLVSGCPVL